jgi:hypothetical protein
MGTSLARGGGFLTLNPFLVGSVVHPSSLDTPTCVRSYSSTGFDLGKVKAKSGAGGRPLKPTNPMNNGKGKPGLPSKGTGVGKRKAKRVTTKSQSTKKAVSSKTPSSSPDQKNGSGRKAEGGMPQTSKPEVAPESAQAPSQKEEVKAAPERTDAAIKSEATTRLAVRNLMKHHFITSADKIRERPNAAKPLSATNPQLYARLERQKEKEENARRLSALTVGGASPQDIERFREEAQAIQEINSREAGLSIGGETHSTEEENEA